MKLTPEQQDKLGKELDAICYGLFTYMGDEVVQIDGRTLLSLADFKKIVEIIEKAESDDNTGTSG